MRRAILNALIRRGFLNIPGRTRFPEDVGLALLRDFPAEATILLYGRGCPALETSTAILGKAIADEVWLPAASCLAKQPGGPVELLQRIQVTVEIEVFGPSVEKGIAGGTPGGVIGGIISDVPNWPREEYHRLIIDRPSQGSIVLNEGAHSVFYGRNQSAWTQTTNPPSAKAARNQFALDLLAERVALPSMRLSHRLRWLNQQQAASDLNMLADEQRQHYADLISRLTRDDLLTPAERNRCPESAQIRVYDSRSDRRIPLPSFNVP
jgi:hypothetical protein